MDIAYLITVFGFGTLLAYVLRRTRKDDEKLAEAICKLGLKIKRLEKYVFPPHDIEP